MPAIPTTTSARLAATGTMTPFAQVWSGVRNGALLPVATIAAIILAVWYLACLPMNRDLPQLAHVDGLVDRYRVAWSLERPLLPAPHQIATELFASTLGTPLLRETADGMVLNPRNLFTHAWVTVSATLTGFVIGLILGIALAIAIVHINALRMSLMPWIVASQTVPILAIAPIIIVALGSMGIVGLLPKAVISAYLSFFPVTIGMTKGLASPDAMLLDLMRTYSASPTEIFFKLRWPAAYPHAVFKPEGVDLDQPGRGHRRRTADRRPGRDWRASVVGLLLRPDRADMVGADHGRDHGLTPDRRHRARRTADPERNGSAAMSSAQTATAGNPVMRLVATLALGTAVAITALLLAHRGAGGASGDSGDRRLGRAVVRATCSGADPSRSRTCWRTLPARACRWCSD